MDPWPPLGTPLIPMTAQYTILRPAGYRYPIFPQYRRATWAVVNKAEKMLWFPLQVPEKVGTEWGEFFYICLYLYITTVFSYDRDEQIA
jgi:hypothetical protein